MSLVSLKCPNCNGDIQMDDSKENGFCMYCGSSFLVKDEVQKSHSEHSGTINLNRKEEAENFAILGEQKYSEKTSFTEADVKYIMENYVEKSLVLDMTNKRALDLKTRLDKLMVIIKQKQAAIIKKSNNKVTNMKVVFFLIFLIPLILVVACNMYFFH